MARKLKPLRRGERELIRQLAFCLVLAEIEKHAVAPAYEAQGGRACDHVSPDGVMNHYLHTHPASARLWKLLNQDVRMLRQGTLAWLKTRRTEDGK